MNIKEVTELLDYCNRADLINTAWVLRTISDLMDENDMLREALSTIIVHSEGDDDVTTLTARKALENK